MKGVTTVACPLLPLECERVCGFPNMFTLRIQRLSSACGFPRLELPQDGFTLTVDVKFFCSLIFENFRATSERACETTEGRILLPIFKCG